MKTFSRGGRSIARKLLTGTALAGVAASAFIAAPAFADNECGVTTLGTVTCTAAGNPFPNGITYSTPPVDPADDPGLDPTAPVYDLTVNLGDGVAINSGPNTGVAIFGFNDGSATLNSFGNTSISVTGVGATGVIGNTNYGDLTINTDSIVTDGRASQGINAVSNTGDITIDATSIVTNGNSSLGISVNAYAGDIDITAGSVTANGYYVGGIYAYAGNGNVTIDAGTVATTGGSVAGIGSDAISVRARGGSIDIAVDTVSTEADYSNGIRAVSFGTDAAVTVTAGDITTNGFASNGAVVQGDTASLTVDNITTSGDYSYGAVMFSTGAGGATFVSTGAISTSGVDSNGVFVKSYGGGDANITVNDVSATGDSSPAVYAYGYNASVTVNGDVSTEGTASRGVEVFAYNGVATVTNNGSISTSGDNSIGVVATGIYGSVVDGAGSVTTNGANSTGILARSVIGDVDVTLGDVTTTGDGSSGVVAISYFGNASAISTGTVSTAGANSTGVYAGSFYGVGDATATVNNVSTTGDNSAGIAIYGYNAAANVNGDVSTAGANSTGVSVYAIGGAADVANNGSITTTGAGSGGVSAIAYGDVTVTGTGSVSSTSTGIDAYSLTGNIDITQGDIATSEAGADGVHAETANALYTAGDITVNVGAVDTAGDFADGIDASAMNGGNIAITHGAITTTGEQSFGVAAIGLYDVSVTGTSVATTGYNAAGVYAVSIFGDVTVDEGTVSTTGDYSPGIVGASYFGNVAITADNVSTSGYSSDGVFGIAINAGNTDITVGNVTNTGDNSIGVRAQAAYDASVTVAGTVRTSGYASDGVNIYAIGAGSVNNAGAIITAGEDSDGIDIQTIYGDVTVTGTGSVTTTGDFSTGIIARTYYGEINIATGNVTTAGQFSGGIDAYASAGVTVTAGTVRTTGDNAIGINAGGFYSVAVTAGTVSTTGANANGVNAASFGGDAIVNAGSVQVSGVGSTAIRAFGFGGGANVNVTGSVRSNSGTAINIIASGGGGGGGAPVGDPALDGIARLTVGSAGSVQGGTNAVTVSSLNGTFITNNGSITGGTGYAIQASGGAATINNNGNLTGRLLLTGNADRLTNTGTFTLIGNSDFGAGSDTLTNTGTVRLGTAAATQAVSLLGLESFANSGLVDLRNGRAGDTLTIANYAGSGAATLGLDIAFGTTTATVDRLNLTTATGSTSVVLAPLNAPAILIPATTIVQATTASSPTAFTLGAGSQNIGLIQFGVAYNPTALAYQLISAPSATVYRQAKLGEGLASVWNRSGDAVTAHMSAGRDAGWGTPTSDSTGRVWLQMFGEVNTRDETGNFSFNGLAQNNVDLGYKQDAFGGQIGVDVLGSASDDGGFSIGVSGGYLSSTMNFRGYGDRFDIEAVNGTVYGAYQAGGFFINGLAKYDHAWINTRGNFAGFNLDTSANTWGGKLETGFRVGSDSFFFEPAISAAYTSTDVKDYGTLGGSFDFDNFTGLRGKAGARIGGSTGLSETSKLVFYAGAAAVHEFKGDDQVRFTSGAQTIAFSNDRLGTYGQGTLGINIVTAGGVTGFIEAHGEYGDDYKGGGGRAGIRIKF
ncbi:hypothetical protein ACVWZA_004211 [Sphingomonas sp. UYAg733]